MIKINQSKIVINNLNELEKLSKEYTELSYKLQEMDSKLKNEILLIKNKYQQKIDNLSQILKIIELSIFDYLYSQKSELFSQKQSLDLKYAKVGFRKSSELRIPEEQELITRLKSLGKYSLITYSESIKKSSFTTLSEIELDLLGVEKIYKELPFIIPRISIK
ncbi:MAG: host-nuclease inhibitor Gam family protein [Brevinema sp.]